MNDDNAACLAVLSLILPQRVFSHSRFAGRVRILTGCMGVVGLFQKVEAVNVLP